MDRKDGPPDALKSILEGSRTTLKQLRVGLQEKRSQVPKVLSAIARFEDAKKPQEVAIFKRKLQSLNRQITDIHAQIRKLEQEQRRQERNDSKLDAILRAVDPDERN